MKAHHAPDLTPELFHCPGTWRRCVTGGATKEGMTSKRKLRGNLTLNWYSGVNYGQLGRFMQ